MTALELVYTRDGVLALLRQDPCPHHNRAGYRPLKDCDRGGWITTLAGLHVLTGDEQDWAMHYAPRRTSEAASH